MLTETGERLFESSPRAPIVLNELKELISRDSDVVQSIFRYFESYPYFIDLISQPRENAKEQGRGIANAAVEQYVKEWVALGNELDEELNSLISDVRQFLISCTQYPSIFSKILELGLPKIFDISPLPQYAHKRAKNSPKGPREIDMLDREEKLEYAQKALQEYLKRYGAGNQSKRLIQYLSNRNNFNRIVTSDEIRQFIWPGKAHNYPETTASMVVVGAREVLAQICEELDIEYGIFNLRNQGYRLTLVSEQ